ncbi:hypothetical protein [Qaidamihabitans albus]|uniref:hypothetical protein n=1 Tax=Qaidamihabitans albus TaxID=2795733 RepID=UPI0018F11A6C|nr:hypothetical protein [Qaidamihabitans albus]
MTWQAELRRLDAELAAGRITHDQHRRQREEILAVESGFPAQRPAAGWQTANPAASQSSQSSQEPPAPPAPHPLLANGWPTTAPSPADERPTDSMPYPNVPPPAPAELTTPIARVPASPARPPAAPPVPAPPPEPVNRGRKLTWLFLALGVLLVLVLIVGGAWWLGRGTDTSAGSAGGTATTAPSAPPASEVALEHRLPALPGEQSTNNSTMSVDKGVEFGLYSAQAATFLAERGVGEVITRGSQDGSTNYLVMILPAASAGEAREVVEHLYQTTLSGGFTAVDAPLRTATGVSGDNRVTGAWYTSGEYAVALLLSQAPDLPEHTLTERLDQVVDSLRAVLPPA